MITFLWALLLVITVLAGLSIAMVLRDGGTAPRFAVSIVCLAAFAVALSVFVDPPDHTGKVALATFVLTSATLGGWPVTASVLRWTLPTTATQPSSLPATGWIGIAERFGFTLALILGLPEVAALVVGVKALGIYAAPSSATTNVTASARVLGSLTSVGWALLVYAAYLVASR